MDGLQDGLITRSQTVLGVGEMVIDPGQDFENDLEVLRAEGLSFYKEFRLELIAKTPRKIAPVILHGVETLPILKNKVFTGVVLGADLASKISTFIDDQIEFISPAHTGRIFGAVPRSGQIGVSDFFSSELSEIDGSHAFVRLSFVQNIARDRGVNLIRFYKIDDYRKAMKLLPNYRFLSWEQKNRSLNWALALEKKVMTFLFAAMTLLVALCITTGFIILFRQLRRDLLSLWLLGATPKLMFRSLRSATLWLCLLSVTSGIILGLVLIKLMSVVGLSFGADLFVEQSIPTKLSLYGFLMASLVPLAIAATFALLAFRSMASNPKDFLQQLRRLS